ncbi:MAG: hypothetical protein RMN24_06870 [Anaerolineae bacterium]|nr:hypothetical protein [Anaerolineae bacterium]
MIPKSFSSPHSVARMAALCLAVGLLCLAIGYWGAWLPHPAAGLAILGLDLAEYVKFVPEVRSGHIALTREVFYNPLISLALGLLVLGTLRGVRLPWWLRLGLVLLAVPVALSMLPPAWTPTSLRAPEFRRQTTVMLLLLAAVPLSPLLQRHVPDPIRGLALLALAVLPVPAIVGFLRLLPALERLYNRPLQPGAALYLTGLGALLLAVAGWLLLSGGRPFAFRLTRRARATAPPPPATGHTPRPD